MDDDRNFEFPQSSGFGVAKVLWLLKWLQLVKVFFCTLRCSVGLVIGLVVGIYANSKKSEMWFLREAFLRC